jgi:hypothetical protein
MTTAREKYRDAVGDALTNWRLGCIALRPDRWREQALYRDGLAEIIALRLRIAYTPLLTGLQRIENRVAILADLREDHYAPKPRRFPMPHYV